MVESQTNINKKNNMSIKRPVLQVAQRVKHDECFEGVYNFQNKLLLAATSEIKNVALRDLQMEVLKTKKGYGVNAIVRKLIVYAINSGVTPEELYNIK